MFQHPEEIRQNTLDTIDTVYDPNPLARGWMLIHGPDIPALNELKNKLIINTPPLLQKKRTIDSVSESTQKSVKKVTMTLSEHSADKSAPSSTSEKHTDKNINNISKSSGSVQQAANTKQAEKLATVQKRPSRILPATVVRTRMSKPVTITKPPQQSSTLSQRSDTSQSITESQATVSPQPTQKRRVLPKSKTHTANKQVYTSFNSDILESNRLFANLNQNQKEVYRAVLSEKKNVLIIGPPGSGKYALLKSIISSLKTQNNHEHIAITAATSAAAKYIQGIPLHSFASMEISDKPADYYISGIRENPTKIEYLKELRVLIIDGISMIDIDVFKKLEYICRKIRVDGRPFGDIQVVLCDSNQLPSGAPMATFLSRICTEMVLERFL